MNVIIGAACHFHCYPDRLVILDATGAHIGELHFTGTDAQRKLRFALCDVIELSEEKAERNARLYAREETG